MKEELMKEVMQQMLPYLDNAQLKLSPSRKNGHKKALKNGMKHSRSGFCGN